MTGDFVEVQAYTVDGDEALFASRIKREDANENSESDVEGPLDGVKTESFVIAGVTLSYTIVTEFEINDSEST